MCLGPSWTTVAGFENENAEKKGILALVMEKRVKLYKQASATKVPCWKYLMGMEKIDF